MDRNMLLIQKIHEAAGEKSQIAITKEWDTSFQNLFEDSCFKDKMFDYESFIKTAKELSDDEAEDTYFSINSFYRKKKQTCRVWHLNAFALDFDFYKIPKYKDLTAAEMYEKHLKGLLELQPTAVVDSGRGLYIIYTFQNAPKAMVPTYKAIYKAFYKKLGDYGMDQLAMNVTQIIRIPGTLNTKTLRTVEVIQYNDTSYKLSDFFYLLPYTREEVKSFKKKRQLKVKKTDWSEEASLKRVRFRDELTKSILQDFRKLIELRNKAHIYDGYRETLIYISRKRIRWNEGDSKEELEVALELNDLFAEPLTIQEVVNRCAPCGVTKCCKISTIIEKLDISTKEQLYMKVLRKKSLKDSIRQKRKARHKLLNLTEKQLALLKRRTMVANLKNKGKKNTYIAQVLTIDKSTVTRDLRYIREHPSKFVKRLREAMAELKNAIANLEVMKKVRFDEQEELRKWLDISEVLLE